MATYTENYNLKKPASSDFVDVADINENSDKLDAALKDKADLDSSGKVPTSQIPSLGYSPTGHTHDDRYYTETEMDTKLSGKSDTSHTHDDRYYTESEVDSKLSAKADLKVPSAAGNVPTLTATGNLADSGVAISTINTAITKANSALQSLPSHNHDDRYYTESEMDTKLSSKSDTSHTHDERYYTESEVDSKLSGKANTSHTHDDRYYTETEINTKLASYIPTSQKGAASGVATLGTDGKIPSSQLGTVGLLPQIIVTVDSGSTVTCKCGSTTLSATSTGTVTFNIPSYGTWTVTATKSGDTVSDSITVNEVKQYSLELVYWGIYGVLWDGTSSTTWSRTDDAANFTNPVPAVGNGTGSSPFDTILPWKGMQKVTDSSAGTLVSIPKFWYKWTRSGNTMKLQIANKYVSGYYVSPAHQDRGDGSGERDVVYVGRYHCGSSAYKSVSGQTPKVSITRATARTNISNLGSTIWQFDYAMLWTIQMLYLVEYGNWNTQATIGYGCGNNSAVQSMGATDSMQYHTGTSQSSRTTYGVGCQYRYIEDLWGNCSDWVDGIYFRGSSIYGIKKPASFSDSSGGTSIGTRATSGGYISRYTTPTASGFEWALYPSAVSGSESTYITDYCDYDSSGVVLRCGGSYDQNQGYGLFYLGGYSTASNSSSNIGCRLQKLP